MCFAQCTPRGHLIQGNAGDVHIGVQVDFTPATKAHPAIRVLDMTALRARLATQKIELVEDDALPGVDRFYIHANGGTVSDGGYAATPGPCPHGGQR